MARTKQTARKSTCGKAPLKGVNQRTRGLKQNTTISPALLQELEQKRHQQQKAVEERFVEVIPRLVEGLRDGTYEDEVEELRKLHTRIPQKRIPVLFTRAKRLVQVKDSSNSLSCGGTNTCAPVFTFIGRAAVTDFTLIGRAGVPICGQNTGSQIEVSDIAVHHLLIVQDGEMDTTHVINLSSDVVITVLDRGVAHEVHESSGIVEHGECVSYTHHDANVTIYFGSGLYTEIVQDQ
jgi:hypothetical protein